MTTPFIDDQGRPEPPFDADEVASVFGFLDYQRATLDWKTRGLNEGGLSTTTAKSTMTLGGILKHMSWVEDHWFSYVLHARDRAEPWRSIDWKAFPDWEWTSALDDTADALRGMWKSACEASRTAVDEALTHGGLDQAALRALGGGDHPSLRWIVLHMIEEYARHNGHADLLREAVDGEVGE